MIFGRIRPIHEEENVSLAPTWMNLIKIAEVCTQEQKYDEIGLELVIPSHESWISNVDSPANARFLQVSIKEHHQRCFLHLSGHTEKFESSKADRIPIWCV